jgi:hypothetical protein
MMTGEERNRRLSLWSQLQAADITNLEPGYLRQLGVYGGAQGIWVDKARTQSVSKDGHGITVSILHTGMHYPDDLSDDGMIYHYPVTRRPPSRDAAEVQATKNAAQANMPIFVILPGEKRTNRRSVKLGWVVDADDASKQFLILFGIQEPIYIPPAPTSSPFQLVDDSPMGTAQTKVRKGQQRFRFHVMAQFGCKCSVCSITHPSLIKAAHIRGKAEKGSDDWRNGIPLCSTHHDAFDAHLFAIEPETLSIVAAPGVSCESIGIHAPKWCIR